MRSYVVEGEKVARRRRQQAVCSRQCWDQLILPTAKCLRPTCIHPKKGYPCSVGGTKVSLIVRANLSVEVEISVSKAQRLLRSGSMHPVPRPSLRPNPIFLQEDDMPRFVGDAVAKANYRDQHQSAIAAFDWWCNTIVKLARHPRGSDRRCIPLPNWAMGLCAHPLQVFLLDEVSIPGLSVLNRELVDGSIRRLDRHKTQFGQRVPMDKQKCQDFL